MTNPKYLYVCVYPIHPGGVFHGPLRPETVNYSREEIVARGSYEAMEAAYRLLNDGCDERLDCSRCDGTGEAQYEPMPGVNPEMGFSIKYRCHKCRGTGFAP